MSPPPASPLTTGDVRVHIRRLFTPMLVGVLAMIAVDLTDVYFVSLLGTTPLAAMSFTFPVTSLITNLCFGLAIGVTAAVARRIGAGERARAVTLSTHALTFSLTLAATLAALAALAHEQIFGALGAPEALDEPLGDYMRWWRVGLPCFVSVAVCNGALRANGDSKTPMRLMLTAAALNLALNPLLIFGLGPVPALGVEGSSLATALARACTFALMLRVMGRQGLLAPAQLLGGGLLASGRELMRVGLPAALTNALAPLAAGVVTSLVALHGAAAVGGYGLAMRLEGLFLIVPMVLGGALSPVVGQSWGAQLTHRVLDALTFAQRVSMAWGVGVCVTLNLLAAPLAALMSPEPAVQGALALYLRLASVSYVAQGALYGANAVFNAVNRPGRATTIALLNSLALAIPLSYVGHILYGYAGIVTGLLAARLAASLLAHRWVWALFDPQAQRAARTPVDVKGALYAFAAARPGAALEVERLFQELCALDGLCLTRAEGGLIALDVRGREVAQVSLGERFDIRLPPQLREAVVREGLALPHVGAEEGWVSYPLTAREDLAELRSLLRITHAYVECAYAPAALNAATCELTRLCEVTRTLRAHPDLSRLTLSERLFAALSESVSAVRAAERERAETQEREEARRAA